MDEFERTRTGKAVLSALIVVLLAIAVASRWPVAVAQRALNSVGFQQSWDVFAPEPLHREVIFDARISYAHGADTVWTIPRSSAAFPYPSHRWELWVDRIVDDSYAGWWDRAARWIVAHHAAAGRRPTRIVLQRQWSELPPPGEDPSLRAWNQFDFFTLDVS